MPIVEFVFPTFFIRKHIKQDLRIKNSLIFPKFFKIFYMKNGNCRNSYEKKFGYSPHMQKNAMIFYTKNQFFQKTYEINEPQLNKTGNQNNQQSKTNT